jgi:hypothetical protein
MSETDHPDHSRVQLPQQLQQAIETFKDWTSQHLLSEQNSSIAATLYHYTDVRGLKGILEAGRIWFTDYRHLNDPSELTHGIDMARDVAHQIATGADGRVRLFLEYFLDLFRHDNFALTLELHRLFQPGAGRSRPVARLCGQRPRGSDRAFAIAVRPHRRSASRPTSGVSRAGALQSGRCVRPA